MPDDEYALDDDLDDDDLEPSEQEVNAHTLSIRRADGTEVVSLSAYEGEPWSVYMEPGGTVQNAYLGSQDDPLVWVDTKDLAVSRIEDGTYVIRLDEV